MTLFFEDVYPSKDAFAYFKEQAGETEVGPILLRMGTLYERHSRFNDQRVVLDKFIEELPDVAVAAQSAQRSRVWLTIISAKKTNRLSVWLNSANFASRAADWV